MKKLVPLGNSLRANRKGQATTELAIAGTLVIMALAYLVQYGYIYNVRQSLEMYTFRKALQLSKEDTGLAGTKTRGVTLTVIRDVILPSFFTGISRQRFVASASVEHNPFIVWTPKQPQYIGTVNLLQINDAMIRQGVYFQIPPTKIQTTGGSDPSAGQTEDDLKWTWVPSQVAEFDSQAEPVVKTSRHSYVTTVTDDASARQIKKQLSSNDTIPMKIVFENEAAIKNNMAKEAWDGTYAGANVWSGTIPQNLNVVIEEEVRKGKDESTSY